MDAADAVAWFTALLKKERADISPDAADRERILQACIAASQSPQPENAVSDSR